MSNFYKYHGLGNDYIVIDPKDCPEDFLTEENAAFICDRHYGIGSDGILYGPIFKDGDIHLKIYNSDGSIAKKSGNGLRIFGQFLYDQGYVSDKKFHVHVLAGTVEMELIDPDNKVLKVHMGGFAPLLPKENPEGDPFQTTLDVQNRTFTAYAVSVGNPHCVMFEPKVSAGLMKEYGPHIERHPSLPHRVNCQFVQVLDRNNIQIEIWERGSEYTLASGSSSTATACMAYYAGYCDQNIKVHMPGGELEIFIQDADNVFLTGPVEKVFEGDMPFIKSANT